jgi:hypothetical protein
MQGGIKMKNPITCPACRNMKKPPPPPGPDSGRKTPTRVQGGIKMMGPFVCEGCENTYYTVATNPVCPKCFKQNHIKIKTPTRRYEDGLRLARELIAALEAMYPELKEGQDE